jgi:hypothetical protein
MEERGHPMAVLDVHDRVFARPQPSKKFCLWLCTCRHSMAPLVCGEEPPQASVPARPAFRFWEHGPARGGPEACFRRDSARDAKHAPSQPVR